MPTGPITHYVFVDFENVQEMDLAMIDGKAVHVTLLMGKNQNRIAYHLVEQVHRLAPQVSLVKLGRSGRNALDMTLSYQLGRLIERFPTAHFFIVSNDNDYEPMIAHAKTKGFKVSRHPTFAALPFLAAPKPATLKRAIPPPKSPVTKPAMPSRQSDDQSWDKIVAHLGGSTVPRPTTRARLLGFLKNRLGKDSTEREALALLVRLQAEKRLAVSKQGKITYR